MYAFVDCLFPAITENKNEEWEYKNNIDAEKLMMMMSKHSF